MERGSTRHGPGLDDQLKKETEPLERGAPTTSRVEEHRVGEEVSTEAEGQLSPDDAETRSLIAKHLDRIVFPGTRDQLVADAIDNNAPPAVIGALRSLPDGTTFENMQQVWIGLGGEAEECF